MLLPCLFTATKTEVQLKTLSQGHPPCGSRQHSSKAIQAEALMVSRRAWRSGVLPGPFEDIVQRLGECAAQPTSWKQLV